MSTKDAATPTGAAEGKQPSAPILRPSRREMLETIGKRRVETFNKEQKEAGSEEFITPSGELTGSEENEDDVDAEDRAAERERLKLEQEAADARVEAAKETKPAKSELDKQLAADDRITVIDDPSKYRVKVKVDGVEQEMSLADVVRVNQKESAADRRLEQASTVLKAAEAKEAAAATALEAAGEAGKAKAERDLKAAQEAKAVAAVGLKTRLKDYNDLLYAGKTDEAADLMVKIMDEREGRSPAATPEAQPVIDMKKLKDEIKSDLRTESALETFAGAYPEIIANDSLAKYADRLFADAVRAGKSEAEAFKAAGDGTRAWVKDVAKSLGMAESKSITTGRESLDKRKETIDEPESASLGTSLKDTSPQESNPRSVIAEMAANRPGAMAHAAAAKRQAGG